MDEPKSEDRPDKMDVTAWMADASFVPDKGTVRANSTHARTCGRF